ncbi:MAG: peroxidase family protein [Bryobacteraceae bacterium]
MSGPLDISPFRHGTVRGSEDPRRSRSFEGRFGRMFRNLPPAEISSPAASDAQPLAAGKQRSAPDDVLSEEGALDALKMLAAGMTTRADEAVSGEAVRVDVMAAAAERDSGIPAGYTYLGQFIDHDLTFDPVSTLQRDNDPEALVNYRTPRFDLDCVYGRGPDDQPYLYQRDGVRMLLGDPLGEPRPDGNLPKDRDVPRNAEGRAIIGDPRNDENVIIAQLHALLLRFHNRMADELGAHKRRDFPEVQRLVRWHYQWVVIHDFLRRVVNETTYYEVLPHLKKKKPDLLKDPPKLLFYEPRREAFLPVEFSAAYRFGHSMVRSEYQLNESRARSVAGPFKILGLDRTGRPDLENSLIGFRRFRLDWAIDWGLFFEGISEDKQAQRAKRIDTTLSEPLNNLPFEFTKDRPSLAARNLIRGWRQRLPSGQAVAAAMGVTPISDGNKLFGLGHPAGISAAFKGNTPLWYYVLAEADRICDGQHLGPVGGRIVMETFVGLLLQDGHSFLNRDPLWTPSKTFLNEKGKFWMPELVKAAIHA